MIVRDSEAQAQPRRRSSHGVFEQTTGRVFVDRAPLPAPSSSAATPPPSLGETQPSAEHSHSRSRWVRVPCSSRFAAAARRSRRRRNRTCSRPTVSSVNSAKESCCGRRDASKRLRPSVAPDRLAHSRLCVPSALSAGGGASVPPRRGRRGRATLPRPRRGSRPAAQQYLPQGRQTTSPRDSMAMNPSNPTTATAGLGRDG
jgi:hypothetical protein